MTTELLTPNELSDLTNLIVKYAREKKFVAASDTLKFDTTGFDNKFFTTLITGRLDTMCQKFEAIDKDGRVIKMNSELIVSLVDFFNRGVCKNCRRTHLTKI
jgi:hypothetical protein